MAALAFVATPLSWSVRHQMVEWERAVLSKASLSLLFEMTWERCRLLLNRPLQGCRAGPGRRSRMGAVTRPIIPATWSVNYGSHRSDRAMQALPLLGPGLLLFQRRADESLSARCVFTKNHLIWTFLSPASCPSDLMALEGCLNGDRQDSVSIPTSPTRNPSKRSIIKQA